jgi:hypothetical protein
MTKPQPSTVALVKGPERYDNIREAFQRLKEHLNMKEAA